MTAADPLTLVDLQRPKMRGPQSFRIPLVDLPESRSCAMSTPPSTYEPGDYARALWMSGRWLRSVDRVCVRARVCIDVC